jgi:restriction system protein
MAKDKPTFADAAEMVLEEAGKPLKGSKIAAIAIEQGIISTEGKTPGATMEAALAVAVKKKGDASRFVRTAPRTYGLRAWLVDQPQCEGVAAPVEVVEQRIRIPHFPTYAQQRALLPALAGWKRDDVNQLRKDISAATGSVTANVDWSDPDEWIPQRLDGRSRELAAAVWKGTKGLVNPRHMVGLWLLPRNYGLLDEDPSGVLSVSARGQDFIDQLEGAVTQELDEAEGLLHALQLVAQLGPASSGDLSEPWKEFLESASLIRSDAAARQNLYQRLKNLLDRDLVDRRGQKYAVTDAGLAWLRTCGDGAGSEAAGPTQQIAELAKQQKEAVTESIKAVLHEMDPYAFEHLIKLLLEAMGYQDVEVTSPSNDKGVDVVGQIELGITSVREVVQVKRHKRNIQRPKLDALRGSLHRFQAVRGTIITTSGFSSGAEKAAFEHGAAPITLINGDKLVELLTQHGIGVKKRKVEVWEFDPSAFEGDCEE